MAGECPSPASEKSNVENRAGSNFDHKSCQGEEKQYLRPLRDTRTDTTSEHLLGVAR